QPPASPRNAPPGAAIRAPPVPPPQGPQPGAPMMAPPVPPPQGARDDAPIRAPVLPHQGPMQGAGMMPPPVPPPQGPMPGAGMMAPPPAPAQGAQAGAPGQPEISSEGPLIAPERERNFIVKEGYDYFLAQIVLTPGLKFGLGLKHHRNRVIVSKVEDGSMVANILKVMDHICDVSSKPVTDKDVCKRLIVKALKESGEVDMIIERPTEPDAIAEMETALNASQMQEPSMALAPDVKDILRRYNEKLQAGHGQRPVKKALTDPKMERKQPQHVAFDDPGGRSHISLIIGCDTTKSQLDKLVKVPPKRPQGTLQGSSTKPSSHGE
ncbi:hypothetical protein V3C99_016816, partial [Haemonchus contortus]